MFSILSKTMYYRFVFLHLLQQQQQQIQTMIMKITPPITPPTILPIVELDILFELLLFGVV